MSRIKVILLIGVLLVSVGFFSSFFKEVIAGIDIVSTENDKKCLSQTGMQLNPDGNIFIMMADGETYTMPLTTAIENANPASYDSLEDSAEKSIEKKFCLEPWAVEIEIADGKYKNITVYNNEPVDL